MTGFEVLVHSEQDLGRVRLVAPTGLAVASDIATTALASSHPSRQRGREVPLQVHENWFLQVLSVFFSLKLTEKL